MFGRDFWQRFMLAPDDGGGAGGGDGVTGGEGDAGVATAGGEGDGAAPQAAFDYDGLAKQFGGPDGLQRAARLGHDINQRAHYNPQFKESMERALRGEYGPAAQAEAQAQAAGQQQPGQQGGKKGPDLAWLKYDPSKQVALQQLHDALLDPTKRDAVLADPSKQELVKDYYRHHDFMQKFWWDPEGWMNEFSQHPSMTQARQQEVQSLVGPMIQQLQHEFDMERAISFYNANKADIDTLPQSIRTGLENGGYGPMTTHAERVQAFQAAIAYHKQLQASGQAPPQGGDQQNVNGTSNANGAKTPPVPGQPPRPNAAGSPAAKKNDGARRFAEAFARNRRES